ncbi:MAG TPA: hypothetical protein PKV69_04850, partial [Candidatus Hydrogenedentes bacterium]|nr:hypothetical protein [Candidatus Hydrogenedentota bacterium]
MSLALMLVAAAAWGHALGRILPLGRDLESWLFRGALGLGGVALAHDDDAPHGVALVVPEQRPAHP